MQDRSERDTIRQHRYRRFVKEAVHLRATLSKRLLSLSIALKWTPESRQKSTEFKLHI